MARWSDEFPPKGIPNYGTPGADGLQFAVPQVKEMLEMASDLLPRISLLVKNAIETGVKEFMEGAHGGQRRQEKTRSPPPEKKTSAQTTFSGRVCNVSEWEDISARTTSFMYQGTRQEQTTIEEHFRVSLLCCSMARGCMGQNRMCRVVGSSRVWQDKNLS